MADQPSASRSDVGPWRMIVCNAEVTLYSDDFEHDVAITISGDFADNSERIAYATDIQERLSASRSEQRTLLDTRQRPGACQHCGHVDPLRAMQEIGEQLATSSAERPERP